jgi:hypothetical protein
MTEGAKQPEAYNHSVNLYWQELERWAGSRPSLRLRRTAAKRRLQHAGCHSKLRRATQNLGYGRLGDDMYPSADKLLDS